MEELGELLAEIRSDVRQGASQIQVDEFLWEIHEKQKQIGQLEKALKTHVGQVDDRFVERNMEIDRLLARIERLEEKVANDGDFQIDKNFARGERVTRKPSLQIQRVEREAGDRYTALSLDRLDAIRDSLNAIASLKTIHQRREASQENNALVLKKCFRRCKELVKGNGIERQLTEGFPDQVTEPDSPRGSDQNNNFVPSRVARARENLSRVTNTLSRVANNSSRVSRSMSLSRPRTMALSDDFLTSSLASSTSRGSRILS